jgi:5-methylcytosine-specific restriction endonuclease McrA
MPAPRKRRRSPGKAPQAQTSVPTSRLAYTETRQWLLARHGPVCAYCERRVPVGTITLDHVTPRRGQSAFDRRDNLVLCCKECNALKKDMSFLAFLLQRPARAVSLLRYGDHLSIMLVDLIHQIAGPDAVARAKRLADPDYPYAD